MFQGFVYSAQKQNVSFDEASKEDGLCLPIRPCYLPKCADILACLLIITNAEQKIKYFFGFFVLTAQRHSDIIGITGGLSIFQLFPKETRIVSLFVPRKEVFCGNY